ncbi:MAG: nitroreductase [Candidatus Scalindua sp. AMX11]|nr:MAG: nitroreductase [Candidatus Scalindua sp.]NOG83938.1 nitroreductase [Planctomycetota bacterium]RZV88009.1 MAG: nitroreductase [Candidatus Scalindua sp. SCAELEC01]TDE64157.1 MAG: nitroreductase [Candidatus Scalindua sp. AMX11]GJQ58413.1 MAG: nitroreductase [Candidatus Scalindua sp.]
MDVSEAIKRRRSIRKFKPDLIPDEKIKELIESARLAPSGTNTQPWRFVIVKDDRTKKELQKAAYNQRYIRRAPVIIACCADLSAFKEFSVRVDELIESGALPVQTKEKFVPYLEKGMRTVKKEDLVTAGATNVAIAVEHIVLRAVELGLGTCWVRWYDDSRVKEILEIPEFVEVMALLPLGVPDEDPHPRPRLHIDKLMYLEKYGVGYI